MSFIEHFLSRKDNEENTEKVSPLNITVKEYAKYCFLGENTVLFDDRKVDLNYCANHVSKGNEYATRIANFGCLNLVGFMYATHENEFDGNGKPIVRVILEAFDRYMYLDEFVSWFINYFVEERRYYTNEEMYIIISSATFLGYKWLLKNDDDFARWAEMNDKDTISYWVGKVIERNVNWNLDMKRF